MKYYYVIDKIPVFLTFSSYCEILHNCEDNGLLDSKRPMIFAGDKKGQKQEDAAICNYLSELKKSDSEQFDRIRNFSLYEDEAKINITHLLEAFGDFYKPKLDVFSDYFWGFIDSFEEKKRSLDLDEWLKNTADLCFPLGKQFYFGFLNSNGTVGMTVFIDTDKIEHVFGNLENFVIHFTTGMSMKVNGGMIYLS